MRTARRLCLSALVAAAVLVGLVTVAEAQRRTAKRRAALVASTAESEANTFWARYVPACNGSRYLKKAASVFVELRGFRLSMIDEPLTDADRLNGIEAKGSSRYSATSSRTSSRGKWGAWQNGMPEHTKLTNTVRFQKTGGKWRFYGVGYFNDYAKPITCADLPGAPVSRRNEVPTGSIQISDTHVFPIQSFSIWDSATNEAGTRFAQSTTTYINWKIYYQGTAFDYPKPQAESYWYKDGKQFSSADWSYFSNTGAGQLWLGKGWDEPGRWEPGRYTIKIYVRKKLVKIAEFEIVPDDELPANLRFDGIYRLDSPPSAPGEVFLVRFYEDGSLLFARTPKSNTRGLDVWNVGSHLSRKKIYGAGGLKISEGRFTAEGGQIEFAVDDANNQGTYRGRYGFNSLDLQKTSDFLLNDSQKIGKFGFVKVRLR